MPFKNDGIKYLAVKLNDGSPELIKETSPKFIELCTTATSFINEAKAQGTACLVHCASGAHRSASIVCGYLMIS